MILILKLEDFLNTMRHLIHKNAIMVYDIITLNGKWQPGCYKLMGSLVVKGLNDAAII